MSLRLDLDVWPRELNLALRLNLRIVVGTSRLALFTTLISEK